MELHNARLTMQKWLHGRGAQDHHHPEAEFFLREWVTIERQREFRGKKPKKVITLQGVARTIYGWLRRTVFAFS